MSSDMTGRLILMEESWRVASSCFRRALLRRSSSSSDSSAEPSEGDRASDISLLTYDTFMGSYSASGGRVLLFRRCPAQENTEGRPWPRADAAASGVLSTPGT